MFNRLVIIGAPSSAGAYAPGQERAPVALRAAGLLEFLSARGIVVDDAGDVSGFRWRADKANPRAMNASKVAAVAKATAERVASALSTDAAVLVLGGDCTVELGTVDGPILATISRVDPPHEFIYEWPPHPRYFSVSFITRYMLDEENGGTRVTFSESGFEAWPDDEVRRARFDRINSEFRMVLENLKAYLEGRNLPHLF